MTTDSPSLKGPTVVLPLVKVTVVATEPVEVQVRVEDGDPGVNIRGLVMLGIAVAGGKTRVYPDISKEEREGLLLLITSLVCRPHLCLN